jgi:hypothetical protein
LAHLYVDFHIFAGWPRGASPSASFPSHKGNGGRRGNSSAKHEVSHPEAYPI